MHGTMPRAYSLDTVGPMTRHARDALLLLAATAGPDPLDAQAIAAPAPDATLPALTPRGMTLAVATPESLGPVAPSILAAHQRAADGFARLGFTLRPVAVPGLGPLHALADAISKSESAALHRRWMTERPQAYARLVYDRTLSGLAIPAVRYIEALSLRAKMAAEFLRTVLGDAAALLLPTVTVETPTIDEVREREAKGDILPLIAGFSRLTRAFNYLGLPAVSMPAGTDANGMPLGVQLAGRPLAEPVLLALVDAFEREVGFGLPARH